MIRFLKSILFVVIVLEFIVFLHASAIMLYFAFFDRILFDKFEDKVKFGEYIILLPYISELTSHLLVLYFLGFAFAFFVEQYKLLPKKLTNYFFYLSLAFFATLLAYVYISENWTY